MAAAPPVPRIGIDEVTQQLASTSIGAGTWTDDWFSVDKALPVTQHIADNSG